MSYEPTPGTIPHKAVAWLRAMSKVRPGYEPSTVELCEGIGIDTYSFTAYMAPVRKHGLVKARHQPGTKILLWSVGDERKAGDEREIDEPLHSASAAVGPRPGPLLPEPAPPPPFRAIEWEGRLLVTGMEIRDGVAIFEPHHIPLLKQHTDWWRSA